MEAQIKWISKLAYQGESRGHKVMLDAFKEVGGQDLGMTPKEMMLNGLCGCTGMDVAALLTMKYKLPVQSLTVSVQAELDKTKKPAVFSRADLTFEVKGEVPADQVIKAVTLSMTQYCGISAMLSKAFPIFYKIVLNGESIGSGQAEFNH